MSRFRAFRLHATLRPAPTALVAAAGRSIVRTGRKYRLPSALMGLLLASLVITPDMASAQYGQGFLFGDPKLSLGVRGGFGLASAGSDIFDFTTEELTLSRSDFNGFTYSGDLGIRVSPYVDLVLTVGYTGLSRDSESRRWEGTDDLPILQTTEFRRTPVTAGIKVYPLDRGRTIGSYAWIPHRITPYLGAGAGRMWYRFRQQGEFVDEETLNIFNDVLASSGWATAAEGFGGLMMAITPHWSLTGEGRYTWARADLSRSFEGFDPIDLAGFSATFGVSVRY